MTSSLPAAAQWNLPVAFGLIAAAYLLGSIPFGLLVGLSRGVDLRRHGSMNIGATNAGRVLGKRFFVLVMVLDALKGFVPTAVAGCFARRTGLLEAQAPLACAWWLAVGFAAVAGHNWPCWLGFRGGKGVATSLGLVLAVYPYYTWPGLAALAVWIVAVKLTGYVSVGSISAALGFLVVLSALFAALPAWDLARHWPLLALAVLFVAVLIVRHRANIARLRSGTENKFLAGATPPAPRN